MWCLCTHFVLRHNRDSSRVDASRSFRISSGSTVSLEGILCTTGKSSKNAQSFILSGIVFERHFLVCSLREKLEWVSPHRCARNTCYLLVQQNASTAVDMKEFSECPWKRFTPPLEIASTNKARSFISVMPVHTLDLKPNWSLTRELRRLMWFPWWKLIGRRCRWLREGPNGVSPLQTSFVRQSETLLVDVTLSVRQIIIEKLHRILSCHERSARVTQVCTLSALVLVTKDNTFLCTEALLPEGFYCRSSILRAANDRILCARKHLCSKARTV